MLAFGMPFSGSTDHTLSKKERKVAVNLLESSMKDIFKTIEKMSLEQWNYQFSKDSWSVAGTCEHLFIAENAIYNNISQNVISDEKNRNNVQPGEKVTDEQVIDKISDRTPANRVKTAEPFEPKGMFASPKEFIENYKAARLKTIAFVETTDSALKEYYQQSPAGNISAYQWMLLLGAHANRHHGQMKEVMADQSFPSYQ